MVMALKKKKETTVGIWGGEIGMNFYLRPLLQVRRGRVGREIVERGMSEREREGGLEGGRERKKEQKLFK